jgi:predicted PurR-regulated permease PerM
MSESKSPPLLSPAQKKIVAAGATALAAVCLIVTAMAIFLVLQRFVLTFRNVLLPLAMAAILATLLRPIITACESRTRLSRTQSIVLLYVLVLLTLGVVATFFLPFAIGQTTALIQEIPTLRDNFLGFIQKQAPEAWEWLQRQLGESPRSYLQALTVDNAQTLQRILQSMLSEVGNVSNFIGSLFGKAAAYSIIPVYLFFLLNGRNDIWNDLDEQLGFLQKERRNDLIFLCRQFSEILTSFFRGQILIGLLLGIVLAIGFSLVGLKFGAVLGIILGLLNIIPYLGTMLGILTVLPLSYFQEGGGFSLIVACAIVFVIGQLLTDYVFTPRIMGDRTGMGPMLIIFSVFFWGVALGGIMGMILAIPLTAFFLVFWRLARERYLPALTSAQKNTAT